jgi:hypothetical protein
MNIRVWKHVGRNWNPAYFVYVGRTEWVGKKYKHAYHELANEFRMEDYTDTERARVVEEYREWLYQKIVSRGRKVIAALDALLALHEKHGRLMLVCHCTTTDDVSGNHCHAQVLARALVWYKSQKEDK